jgi:serine/threonine protein kinase/Tfp pilus assembly protein PilF
VSSINSTLTDALRDRYVIERELGRGGMACVYLAQDLRHDRRVAVKVLRSELAFALGPERFLQEIKLAARLQHPHILPVFDSGDANGQLWYAMPYVEGESLRERMRREGQLSVDEALRLTREVADALDYAHAQGLLHRDIKPENILLSQRHALISDFGIAQVVQGDERLTETGLTMGTPAYMSPEQAAGEWHLDRRTDLYSLAAVLYEMLTGEPPYAGPTAQALSAKRLSGQLPPVRRVRPTVSEPTEAAISKALAPVPADRFASVGEFAAALTATTFRPGSPGRRRQVLAVALLTVVLLAAWALFVSLSNLRDGVTPDPARPKRLAVLPFQNLGDSSDAYFADGITDEIRGKLASVPGLEVIARASSERYQRAPKSPAEIGRELNVDYLLTGTVRWAKGSDPSRVRVSPELVRTGTSATTWQEPFEAPLTDVFQVQADIASRVAQALDQALGDSARRVLAERPTKDLTAYTFYLRGRHQWNTRTEEGLRKAVNYFQQAIERDSGYARAYAGLADAYLNLADYHFLPGAEATPRAQAAAQQALALDSSLAEAHASLGGILESRWQWRASEREYRKAIALNPSYPTAHHWLALLMIKFSGQSDEALREIRRALELDPLSLPISSGLAEILYLTRQYNESIAQSQKTLELQADFPWALETLGLAYAAKGRYAEAIQTLQQALRRVPENPQLIVDLAYVYAGAGRRQESRALVARLKAPKRGVPTPEYIGLGYAALGEIDSALYWLERAVPNARSSGFQTGDPRMASLSAIPRYRALLKKMGLE